MLTRYVAYVRILCVGNYATVFDEIWQDDLTEMLSNLNRGGNILEYQLGSNSCKTQKCEHTDISESGYVFSATLQ